MSRESPPVSLRTAIETDLSAVVPLDPPWRRSRLLLAGGLLVLLGIYLGFGLRVDATRIGPAFLWGLSALQAVAGVLLLAAALRESVPGEALKPAELNAAFFGLGLWIAGVTWLTWSRSPTSVPEGLESLYRLWCIGWPIALALPLIAVGLFLARRAFPLRPHLVGALLGAGSGAIVDAGWRTFCEVSAPDHILGTHALALAAAVLLGAVAGALTRPFNAEPAKSPARRASK